MINFIEFKIKSLEMMLKVLREIKHLYLYSIYFDIVVSLISSLFLTLAGS